MPVLARDSGIYRYIHGLTNSRSLPLILHTDSTEVTTDIDKANAFNQYFYSVFRHDTSTTLCNENLPNTSSCICTCSIDISVEEVFDALITLNPNKASGLDNIGPSILKNSASILSKPLHYLYSLSLSS